MSEVDEFYIEKWPIRRLLHASTILQDHLSNLFVKKTQDMSLLYNLSMESEAQKFSEFPGNNKPEDITPHSADNSYL